MATPEQSFLRWKRIAVVTWSVIGIIIIVGVLLWLLGRIGAAVVPFLMAAVLVFLLRWPVGSMERDGVPRVLSIIIAYVVAIAVVVVLGLFLLPALGAQFMQFVHAFPGYYGQASKFVGETAVRVLPRMPVWAQEALANFQTTATARLGQLGQAVAGGFVSAGGSVVTFFADSVLALFIAFYVLLDLPTIRADLLSLFTVRARPEAELIMGEVSTVVGGFLRGQFLIALVNGILTALGLWLIRMPYAGIIGLITGVLSVIPYIGPLVGGVIVAVTGLFVSWQLAALGLAVMVAVQQVEGSVLAPRIMSREVDLHPALVIFSLLVGAELAGLVGMLVAIPVAATGKALFVHYLSRHHERAAAEGKAGDVPPKATEAEETGERLRERAAGEKPLGSDEE